MTGGPALFHVVAAAGDVQAGRGVIGKNNALPWHFSSDLKHFKAVTLGHPILMGRKTFESIGRALPGRQNIVLSRSGYRTDIPDVLVYSSIEEARRQLQAAKAFIIGGSELYRQTFDIITGIYLTRIHADFDGDAFYPKIPEAFELKSSETVTEKDVRLEFQYLERKRG